MIEIENEEKRKDVKNEKEEKKREIREEDLKMIDRRKLRMREEGMKENWGKKMEREKN